jgi:hypothetical protein
MVQQLASRAIFVFNNCHEFCDGGGLPHAQSMLFLLVNVK